MSLSEQEEIPQLEEVESREEDELRSISSRIATPGLIFLTVLLRNRNSNSLENDPVTPLILRLILHSVEGTQENSSPATFDLDTILDTLFRNAEPTPQPIASSQSLKKLPNRKISATQIKQQNHCTVCIEKFTEDSIVVELPCTHIFDKDCVFTWLESHNTCPICRYELPIEGSDLVQEDQRKKRMASRNIDESHLFEKDDQSKAEHHSIENSTSSTNSIERRNRSPTTRFRILQRRNSNGPRPLVENPTNVNNTTNNRPVDQNSSTTSSPRRTNSIRRFFSRARDFIFGNRNERTERSTTISAVVANGNNNNIRNQYNGNEQTIDVENIPQRRRSSTVFQRLRRSLSNSPQSSRSNSFGRRNTNITDQL